jgi:hypothetical protein
MATIERPYFPIIFVRGYAGNDSEIEDTVAEPYMGFNLGSTKFRQCWDGRVLRHYFESPLFRLVKDYGYTDVYSGGQEMPLDSVIGPKSVFIYRYYDEQYFDALMGREGALTSISGQARKIEDFAEGLSRLILRIRERICGTDQQALKDFRVYLVAHSMGGLVCRCFLQNMNIGSNDARYCVDKVFTYATPHNGIDFKVIGNVPGFFTLNDANNFNQDRMAQYLGQRAGNEPANLEGKFDPKRFFCLVGTDSDDYSVAAGWSKRLVGPMSDGLVRIVNATVYSQTSPNELKLHAPQAFVNRSHSGHFGIVNSEEGYQNLARFLFGDMRIDGVLELDEITLPEEVEKAKQAKQQIRASYNFEVVVRVRGYDWELHRRVAEDSSAIFRTYDEMFPDNGKRRNPYLFSTFLSTKAKVSKATPSLGFAIDLRVLVPEYEIDGSWWRDQHYKGSYLYRDSITIEATPATMGDGKTTFAVQYGFDSKSPNRTTDAATVEAHDGKYICRIPIASGTTPGLKGKLVLTAKMWS